MSTENRNIYRRDGAQLHYETTALAQSPEKAAEIGVGRPGKYVVTNMDFTEITKVNVTLTAREDA